MTAPAMPYGYAPGRWLESPWQQWVVDVGMPSLEALGWAARNVAQALAVAALWPVRLAWLLLRKVHWGSGETWVSTVVLGMPTALLVTMLPHVTWPTAEQALRDLIRLAWLLAFALVFTFAGRMAHTGGARACTCGQRHFARHFAPSPADAKTWRWIVAVHEAGHLVVGKKLGRRTGGARILGNGGLTQVFPDHSDITGEIAIDMAGGIAAGTRRGCDGDRSSAHWRLRRFVAPGRRSGVMSAGTRLARRKVAEHRGEIERVARRLYRTGRAS